MAKFNVDERNLEQEIVNTMGSESPNEFASLQAGFYQDLLNEIETLKKENIDFRNEEDMVGAGFRRLTSEEKNFYNKVVEERTLAGQENAEMLMPETIVLRVFEEIQDESPLLGKININYTRGVSKLIYTKAGTDIATWDEITSEIEPQLKFSIETLDISQYKLKAYMVIPQDLLEPALGIYWLDRYVVQFLVRGMRRGLEKAIIEGTGVKQPIGLLKDVEGARIDGDPYPDKETVALTELSPAELGTKVEGVLNEKNVGNIVFVLNNSDYVQKWRPLLAYQTYTGQWAYNTLPIPADVVVSEFMPAGKAVAFRTDKYHLGVSLATKVEKSDHNRFLEDDRVYKAKLFANGRPEDANTAVVLDISELSATTDTTGTV